MKNQISKIFIFIILLIVISSNFLLANTFDKTYPAAINYAKGHNFGLIDNQRDWMLQSNINFEINRLIESGSAGEVSTGLVDTSCGYAR